MYIYIHVITYDRPLVRVVAAAPGLLERRQGHPIKFCLYRNLL